jgi:hypothetical protein
MDDSPASLLLGALACHRHIRVDARDYVTGRGLGGVVGRNHFLPMLGLALHY